MHNDKKRPSALWYIIIGFSALIILCATACICTLLIYLSRTAEMSKAAEPVAAPSSIYDNSAHVELAPVPPTDGLANDEIYAKVAPCIVDITTFYSTSPGMRSEGSGIIISEDGLIVTNAHVVDGDSYRVMLNNGDSYMAYIIGADVRSDIAVLQIDATGLPAAELGEAQALRIGERVLAIGNATGEFSHSLTVGIVSGLGRTVYTSEDGMGGYTMRDMIQTDAAINPGNSGGALVNGYGQIVGIITLRLVEGDLAGIGFAIPLDKAKPVIDSIIDIGYMPHAALGIMIKDYEVPYRMYKNTPLQGVLISEIQEASSFTGTAVVAGDIIISADGMEIVQKDDLLKIINEHRPNDELTLLILHTSSGNISEYTVKLRDAKR